MTNFLPLFAGVFVHQVSNADFDDNEDRDRSTTRANIALETLQMGVAREGVSLGCFYLPVPCYIRALMEANAAKFIWCMYKGCVQG